MSVQTSEPIQLGALDKVRKSRELRVGLRKTRGFHSTDKKGIDDRLLAGIADQTRTVLGLGITLKGVEDMLNDDERRDVLEGRYHGETGPDIDMVASA